MEQKYLYCFETKEEYDEARENISEPYAVYVEDIDKMYYPHTAYFAGNNFVDYENECLALFGGVDYYNDTLNVDGFATNYENGNLTFN